MKDKIKTVVQLVNLLECGIAAVTDKLNGGVHSSFNFDVAELIKKVFFQKYEYNVLF